VPISMPFSRRRRSAHLDPPEEWELAIADDLATHVARDVVLRTPFRPKAFREAPGPAVDALIERAGVRHPSDILVVPGAIRGAGTQGYYAPLSVFGVGSTAVALWVDDLGNGFVAESVLYSEVAVVASVAFARYNRARIVGTRSTVAVRCGYTGRYQLAALLDRIRRRVSSTSLTSANTGQLALPDVWDEAPVMPTAGTIVAVASPHRRPGRAIAIVTEDELVIVRARHMRSYAGNGFDTVAVARSRLTGIAVTGHGLRIHVGTVVYDVVLDNDLRSSIRREFDELLPWS
jgi:hypothetical protein